MYHLENEYLKITVALKGAELTSIFNKVAQQELLWQGNPAFWGKSSPVLFPIVGTLKNDTYIYNQKEYKLPRHGFARDYNFELKQISENQLVFSLGSSAETLKVYPFLFRLQIIYTLEKDCLKVDYKVENVSDVENMYFSLGAHPAFNVGTKADDFAGYKLLFNNDEKLRANYLKNSLLIADKNTITLTSKKLALDYNLFDNDALVLLDMKSYKVSLVDNEDKTVFSFKFENFPYFGLWTVKDSGFICLEPWAGFSDFETHNQKLENKAGINKLQPKELWYAYWEMTINL